MNVFIKSSSLCSGHVQGDDDPHDFIEVPVVTEGGDVFRTMLVHRGDPSLHGDEESEPEATTTATQNKSKYGSLLDELDSIRQSTTTEAKVAPKGNLAAETEYRVNNVISICQKTSTRNQPSVKCSSGNKPSVKCGSTNEPSVEERKRGRPTGSRGSAEWASRIDSLRDLSIAEMIPPRRSPARADRPGNTFGDSRKLRVAYRAYRFIVMRWRKELTTDQRVKHQRLEAVFGTKEIGRWLRANLLVITNDYAAFPHLRRCYEYIVNEAFLVKLRDFLSDAGFVTDPDVILYEHYEPKLRNALAGCCIRHRDNEAGDGRWYNAGTGCPKEVRKWIFIDHGFFYDYDIAACKPTILYWTARGNGFVSNGMIDDYLARTKGIRQYLAKKCGMDYWKAKEAIGLLFGGHKFSYSEKDKSMRRLFASKAQFDLFGKLTVELRDDIRGMLKWVFKREDRQRDENGSLVRLTEADYHGVFLRGERTIRQAMQKLLMPQASLCFSPIFWIHDGWTMSEKLDDLKQIEAYLLRETGFGVRIEFTDFLAREK